MKVLKQFSLCLFLILASLTMSSVANAADWSWATRLDNNGANAQTSNANWMVPGVWGARTEIQPNKLGQLEQDRLQYGEVYFYAYSRGISFPRPIGIDEFSIVVEPRGYQRSGDRVWYEHGHTVRVGFSTYEACAEEHNYVDYYVTCAETGERKKLNDSIPDGDWNDPRGCNNVDTGYQPIYYPARGENASAPRYTFTAANWPFQKDQHIASIEVVNRVKNSYNMDTHFIFCIDVLTVTIVNPNYPQFVVDQFTSGEGSSSLPYTTSDKPSEYWFPYGHTIDYWNKWIGWGSPLQNMYFRFSEGLDYDDKRKVYSYVHSPNKNAGHEIDKCSDFAQITSSNDPFNSQDPSRATNHYFLARAEKDYSVAVEAINQEGRWQEPDRLPNHPVKTPSKLRLDFTPPFPRKYSASDNKLASCTIDLQDIVDLNAKQTQDGSGFRYLKIALYPAAVANQANVKTELLDSDSDIWSGSLASVGATSFKTTLKYPSRFASYYGYWICRIRLFDNVGNHTDVTNYSATPGVPDPVDPLNPSAPPKYPDTTIKIFRADPTPELPGCRLKTWQYKNPSNSDYWVNCSDFQPEVECEISSKKGFSNCADLSKSDAANAKWFPTGTELFMRAPSEYGSKIPSKFRETFASNSGTAGYFKTATGSNLKNLASDAGQFSVSLLPTSRTSYSRVMNGKSLEHLKITTNCVLQGSSASHGKKFSLFSSGYTVYEGARFNCPTLALAQNRPLLCFDDKAPDFTWIRTGKTKIAWSCTDLDSGIKSITFAIDADGKFPINVVNVDSAKKQVTSLPSRALDLKDKIPANEILYAITSDNVGNKNAFRIKMPKIPVDAKIIVDDKYNIVKDRDLEVEALLRPTDNKYCLKVTGSAKIAADEGYLKQIAETSRGFDPKFRLTGSGEGVDHISPDYWHYQIQAGLPNKVLASGGNPFSSTHWICDNVNSITGPNNFKYNRSTTSAFLSWDDLEDPRMEYSFALQSKLFAGDANWDDEITTGVGRVKFASGRDHYVVQIYSGTALDPSKLISQIPNSTSSSRIDVSKLKSGTYTARLYMVDKNGNPSGERILTFQQDEPSNFSPYRVEVGAVKDVDWEGLKYPIVFGETNSETIYPPDSGRDLALSDYFPLGKKSFAKKLDLVNSLDSDSDKIAKGYGVAFRLIKENKDEMDDIILKFSFKGDHGESLLLMQNGIPLADVDSSENANFTQLDISASEIASLPDARTSDDSARIYKYHFLPENFEAYTSTGGAYKGDVTVHVDVYSKVAGVSSWPLQQFDFYTVTQDELASDDLQSDKQR